MGPGPLAQVLRQTTLSQYSHPDLLVGLQTSDDAAVFRMSDDLAIVQTVDFFPPVVDDPFTYGAIAAANSMSDVYAMGGEVMLALNIAAFPDDLPGRILAAIMDGGAAKVAEAGGVIAGGHTVSDPEPKYGLAVTGTIHPDRILTKAGAKVGDRLYLTKPLGTGALTTAMKNQAIAGDQAAAAIESMLTLNRRASQVAREVGINACTDITGFGLIGHASEMADKSGVRLELFASAIPWLPGAIECARGGQLPGGVDRNREYFTGASDHGATVSRDIDAAVEALLFDPETSGPLLISVSALRSETLEAAFASSELPLWRIGEVTEGSGVAVLP